MKTIEFIPALKIAFALFRENGYHSVSSDCSSKSMLEAALTGNSTVQPTDEDTAAVQAMLKGVAAMSIADAEAIRLDKVREFACAQKVPGWMLGYIAFAPCAWDRYLAKKAQLEKDAHSRHLGAVGQRIQFMIVEIHDVGYYRGPEHDSYRGPVSDLVTIWKIIDQDGNVLMWHTSTDDNEVSSRFTAGTYVNATVVYHGEYKGVQQTKVARLREIA